MYKQLFLTLHFCCKGVSTIGEAWAEISGGGMARLKANYWIAGGGGQLVG